MARPVLNQHTESVDDDTGSISGNLLTSYASDVDGDIVTVARINSGYVAGPIGGGKGSDTFVGTYGTLTVAQDGTFNYVLNSVVYSLKTLPSFPTLQFRRVIFRRSVATRIRSSSSCSKPS